MNGEPERSDASSARITRMEEVTLMRVALVGALVFLSGSAWAQTAPSAAAPPPNDPTKAHYMSAAEIASGVAKLGNDRPDVAFRIFQIAPYTVNAAHRAPVAQVANLHDANTELFMVMEGTATMVTGGKILGETRNGANVIGKSIEGGTSQKLSKGDFLLVPAGVPHWFTNIAPGGISLMQLYLPKAN
jgi:mannose-6-phosphate isomerase-like protein (cupin superfamily)